MMPCYDVGPLKRSGDRWKLLDAASLCVPKMPLHTVPAKPFVIVTDGSACGHWAQHASPWCTGVLCAARDSLVIGTMAEALYTRLGSMSVVLLYFVLMGWPWPVIQAPDEAKEAKRRTPIAVEHLLINNDRLKKLGHQMHDGKYTHK